MKYLRIITPRSKGSKIMNQLKEKGAKSISCLLAEGSANAHILEVLEIDEVPMFNQYEKLEKPKKPLTLRVTLPMKVLLTSLNNA